MKRLWNAVAWLTGESQCQRCRRPWSFAEPHSVRYWTSEDGHWSQGFFALCESCWPKTTRDERVNLAALAMAEYGYELYDVEAILQAYWEAA